MNAGVGGWGEVSFACKVKHFFRRKILFCTTNNVSDAIFEYSNY